LEAELAVQKGIVAALLKRIYGAKSEKMSHEQLLLEFLGDEAKKPAAAAPDDLRLLGEETSERLHVKPTAFTLEIIKRLTHVRINEVDAVPLTPPLTSPLAPCLLPGSVLTPSLGAHLLTQKFCYHSTFYREQWKLKAAHGTRTHPQPHVLLARPPRRAFTADLSTHRRPHA
jgi:hypothetical protein